MSTTSYKRPRVSLSERITRNVIHNDNDCWIWQLSKKGGYGRIGIHELRQPPAPGAGHGGREQPQEAGAEGRSAADSLLSGPSAIRRQPAHQYRWIQALQGMRPETVARLVLPIEE